MYSFQFSFAHSNSRIHSFSYRAYIDTLVLSIKAQIQQTVQVCLSPESLPSATFRAVSSLFHEPIDSGLNLNHQFGLVSSHHFHFGFCHSLTHATWCTSFLGTCSISGHKAFHYTFPKAIHASQPQTSIIKGTKGKRFINDSWK